MPIQYKVVTKKPGLSNQERYYPVLTGRKAVGLRKVCEFVSERSSFHPADVMGIVEALISAVPHFLSMGQNIRLDGLGTFSVHAASKGQESADKITSRDITDLKLTFLPDKRIKQKLKSFKFTKVK